MEFRNSFVIIFVLCAVVCAKPRHDYSNHLKRVANFQKRSSCSTPQEKIVQLNEIIFTAPTLANEKISPTISVLHRCDSCSGCFMQPGYTCTAKTSEMVDLTFYVTTIDNSSREYRMGTAQNHTSCWCQPASSIK